jgi:hypothetical protein
VPTAALLLEFTTDNHAVALTVTAQGVGGMLRLGDTTYQVALALVDWDDPYYKRCAPGPKR